MDRAHAASLAILIAGLAAGFAGFIAAEEGRIAGIIPACGVTCD